MDRAMRSVEQINLKATEREVLRRAATILRSRFGVERIIRFGSKARGDRRSDSDLDLLALTARPVNQAEKARIVSAVFDLPLELNVLLSIMVASAEEWESGYRYCRYTRGSNETGLLYEAAGAPRGDQSPHGKG